MNPKFKLGQFIKLKTPDGNGTSVVNVIEIQTQQNEAGFLHRYIGKIWNFSPVGWSGTKEPFSFLESELDKVLDPASVPIPNMGNGRPN